MLASIKTGAHGAWQDDFSHWEAHNKKYTQGKPFPIDIHNKNVVSIFFDDNAKDQEILSIQTASGDNADQAHLQNRLIKLGRIVAVNTLKAILDENYFKKCVDFALQQHRIPAISAKTLPMFASTEIANSSSDQSIQQNTTFSLQLNPCN